MKMKRVFKFTNVYLVTGFMVFFVVLYLISLVFINSGISGGSSVEIYEKQLAKQKEAQKKHELKSPSL